MWKKNGVEFNGKRSVCGKNNVNKYDFKTVKLP